MVIQFKFRLRSFKYYSLARTLFPERMGEAMQIFGALLFMWGGLDWFMSTDGVDVYYDWFGIYLPDAITAGVFLSLLTLLVQKYLLY